MKRLTLVRHAKAVDGGSSMTDLDRPLNHRGKADAPEMGRRLSARGILPDAVVSSPAKRARSTARKISREIGVDVDEIREDPAIYDASLDDLLNVVHSFDPQWDHVLLVGHNPGLVELAHYFLGNGQYDLPTCAVLALSFDLDEWKDLAEGTGATLFYDIPKGTGDR